MVALVGLYGALTLYDVYRSLQDQRRRRKEARRMARLQAKGVSGAGGGGATTGPGAFGSMTGPNPFPGAGGAGAGGGGTSGSVTSRGPRRMSFLVPPGGGGGSLARPSTPASRSFAAGLAGRNRVASSSGPHPNLLGVGLALGRGSVDSGPAPWLLSDDDDDGSHRGGLAIGEGTEREEGAEDRGAAGGGGGGGGYDPAVVAAVAAAASAPLQHRVRQPYGGSGAYSSGNTSEYGVSGVSGVSGSLGGPSGPGGLASGPGTRAPAPQWLDTTPTALAAAAAAAAATGASAPGFSLRGGELHPGSGPSFAGGAGPSRVWSAHRLAAGGAAGGASRHNTRRSMQLDPGGVTARAVSFAAAGAAAVSEPPLDKAALMARAEADAEEGEEVEVHGRKVRD